MKSGISSFNKGLFQQHVRSVLWVSIFFTLALLVVLPLFIWMIFMKEEALEYYFQGNYKNGLLAFSYSVQYIIFMIFPVITGLILTNYLTKKGSSDFMHSLPFKRKTLLSHVYMAGGTALVLPILLNGIVLTMMRPLIKPAVYTIGDVAGWMGLALLIVLMMFVVTVFVGLFIGSPLLQGVMTYGIFILPGALIMLFLANASFFINGLAADAYIDKVMSKGIFLVRAAMIVEKPFSGIELTVYIGLAVLLAVLSYVVYKARPAEAVDETIVFPFFRWLFIFSFTLAAMLIGGLYFAEFLDGALGWTILGYIIGAFAGYTILQMIVQKTLRLTWPWKGFVLYIAVLVVLFIPIAVFTGFYEKKVPAENEVVKVYVGDNIAYDLFDMGGLPNSIAIDKKSMGYMEGRESIHQTIDLHKQLIKNGHLSRQRGYQIGIAYKLKDGSRVERQYYVEMEQLNELTKELRDNQEFKRKTSLIFAISRPEKISYLAVADYWNGTNQMRVTDQKEMAALIRAMKHDALNERSRRFKDYDFSNVGEVQVWFTDGQMMSVPIYLDQAQTMNYIRQKVKGGSGFFSMEQVEEAYILTTDTQERRRQLVDYIHESSDLEKESVLIDFPIPAKKVTDPKQLKQLLDPARLSQDSRQTLLIRWKGNKEISAVGIKE
ncbi:DUF6449 domain-containing protein [Bacillus sp. B190/17]|uniref:DUF6449 domain-containing protein n=1 Tax=Bacillus lumedeiriae TaxID=3058829 RepID=A0ABW8I9A2_9BACI